MNNLEKVLVKIIDFIGDVKIFQRPLFLDIKYKSYKGVSKEIYFDVLKVVGTRPCILGRYYEEYLSSKFIGDTRISHLGLYTGRTINGIPHAVIHAIGDGVVIESLFKFCCCDKLQVIDTNLSPGHLNDIVEEAIKLLGTPYNFLFDPNDDSIYCSQLIFKLFTPHIPFKMKNITKFFFFKRFIFEPKDALEMALKEENGLKVIYNFE